MTFFIDLAGGGLSAGAYLVWCSAESSAMQIWSGAVQSLVRCIFVFPCLVNGVHIY